MSSGLPVSIQDVRTPPGFVLLDVLLAVGDVAVGSGLVQPLRAISFAVAGNIEVDTLYNHDIIPSGNLAAGIQHGCVIKKIYAAGTTATGLIGWY